MLPNRGTYVPTLAVRASEMRGLEFLPAVSKARMMPLFLLAPWFNSKTLDRTIERIERAYPRRLYFLDIDRDYIPKDAENSLAQAEWLELRDPSGHFEAWRSFCMKFPALIPCLQVAGQDQHDLRAQVEKCQENEREFCWRIELTRMPPNIQTVVDILIEIGTADFSIVIEGGWVEDPLTLYARTHGMLTGLLSDLDGRIPIVVSCTSMPKGFSHIVGVEDTPFSNHQLLDDLRRDTNRDNLLFGDWGSTRPREDSFGQAPFPRIDYATNDSWHFSRNRDGNWGYREAARAIIERPVWDGELGIWGEDMIRDTARTPDFAIDTPQKNIASRVNIHLHRQALYGDNIHGLDLDEDWID
ncbi:MAG: beta family protein [Defluviicoccus sp.]|nr:beta family protein [Defluviicoccus sp.]